MMTYSPGAAIGADNFRPFDALGEGGAESVSGELGAEVRIDHEDGRSVGGVFRQRRGRAVINWPNTEHSFVLEGEVKVTDHDSGRTVIYRPGDGFLIPKGARITWEVTTPGFAKAFFFTIA